jgi:hypothetical protein
MKSILMALIVALGAFSPVLCFGDEPTINYANDAPAIGDNAKHALADVLSAAHVSKCTITSTARTIPQQAKAMYDYIAHHSVDAAEKLYGSEGKAVVDVYVNQSNAHNDRTKILAAMEAKIIEVLPAAREHNHLMHVDRPDFDVFDVSMASIPGDKRTGFLAAAKASTAFHRVLGPGEGEKDCYHFEFKKGQ